MKTQLTTGVPIEAHETEPLESVAYDFGLSRRGFVHVLGAGLLIAASGWSAVAQQRGGGRGGGPRTIAARIHLAKDGTITVLAGKVEGGQGARAELTQAAAEELRVAASRIQLILADTGQVPDDGMTAGSGSTPRTVPAVRQGAAAARELLIEFAGRRWGVERGLVEMRDGKAFHVPTARSLSYADLAASDEEAAKLNEGIPSGISLSPVKEWKVLGVSTRRPNARDLVTGAHLFPSDISRPDMLFGKVLRAPAYNAKLIEVDLEPAKALKQVVVVRDDSFVGVAAPTLRRAEQALAAIAKTARWERSTQPSSKELYEHLTQNARGGLPANPFSAELAGAKQVLRQTYQVPYAQHAPLEPRAAVAEWTNGKLTVWTGTQNPFGCRSELARAFHVGEEQVRVVVPDFGGGFGGKHTGEAGVEAARLARAAGQPVSLRWTRAEEFTWAYFRPAGVILIEASLDEKAGLTSWHAVNLNSGRSSLDTPYRAGKTRGDSVESIAPLRQGSYRALAATANTFARESFMDELAVAAGLDPLQFRLVHLENPRLRAVLETAAQRFGWAERSKDSKAGIGLACGTEKGSYVAACAEIEVDRAQNRIVVRRACQVFECGAVLNPENLLAQVQGALLMGLGPALREEILFENGEILTASFSKYRVPRFQDVPELDIHIIDRPDLEPSGAGETPIIAIAPAIANALFRATGRRLRSMPLTLGA